MNKSATFYVIGLINDDLNRNKNIYTTMEFKWRRRLKDILLENIEK